MASLIVQLSIVVIISVSNNLMNRFGYETIAGTGEPYAAVILRAMGDSLKAAILALLRDVIAFVPASLILAYLSHSIVTMLWAAMIADVIAAVTAFIFVSRAIKKL